MAISPIRRILGFGWPLVLAAGLCTLFALVLTPGVQAQDEQHHDHAPPAGLSSTADGTALHTQSEPEVAPHAPGAGASLVFHAALSGAKENPVVITRASGYAVIALSDAGTSLSYRVLLDDIEDVTAAHIHRVSDGGVELPLTVGAGGTISGTIDGITVDQMAGLLDGAYYINVHTTAHGGGEIAGPIVYFTPPTGYSALLDGASERPNPVDTDAIGVASFTLVSTSTLTYSISISNSTAITLGHIHRGDVNTAGGVVHPLYNSATPLPELIPLTGSVDLDAQAMVDLLTGYLYVNFHTAAHPAGEIRGQIGGAHLFGANLDGGQEMPPVDTLAYGKAVVALSADASQLVYRVTAYHFDEPITVGHFHRGPRGVSGPPEIFLPSFGSGLVVTGTAVITPGQVFRLMAGAYYVNLHTATHSGGEIRGQVEPLAVEARYSALLSGADEEPEPVVTNGAGFARFKVRPVINVVNYYLAVTDIDNLVGAHIHKAPAGEDNPAPLHFLYTPANGDFDPDHPASGALIFDGMDFVDLISGFFYVNVHSTDHPGGEIRGQIGRAHLFVAYANGAEEVPPHVTDAFGLGVFALNADASQLAYRLFANGMDAISLAHIHTGKPGVNGPPDFTLFDGTGLFDDAHPVSGTLTLTDVHVLKLVSGAYYVNVHIPGPNNPGFIRGQLEPANAPTQLNALLNGANERPNPVQTDAVGVAHLGWDPYANTLHVRIAVTNSTGITMAHIHRGPADQAGGVVHWLYRTSEGAFDNETPLIRDLRFSHRDLVDLFSGWFYINVHTVANLGGEIRGQIGTQRAFQSLLDGSKERPTPVNTAATGVGTLVLTGDASELHYRIVVTNITDITLAHIHVGGPEAAGPPVHTLFPSGSSLFDPAHPISGSVSLSASDLLHLAGGTSYLNVHTHHNPGGEIRGQIDPYQPFGRFATLLTEAAEVAAAQSEASGLATFQLSEYPATTLQYEVSVSNIPTVTLAHIHEGLPGVSGPPIFTLTGQQGELSQANPLGGAVALNAGQLLDLLTGYYYVNVHTVEHPGGQIRGQIYIDGVAVALTLPLIYSVLTP
jgi:hypothetical protein